ncbi:MAG: hypothetical protein ACYDAD_16085 [Acidimicrobiales bacterium]
MFQPAAGVVTDRHDDEPAGHHPERYARDVLGDVLANEPAVTAGQALDVAAASQYDAAELFNRHRHATRTHAEYTLAAVLEARGAGELLDEPEAWRLIDETERAFDRGLDPAAILAAATDDQLVDVDSATHRLWGARYLPQGEPVPYRTLVAGLVPAPPPSTPPDMAAYLDGLTAGTTRRRDTLAAQYQAGPVPAWAANLGKPPPEPAVRARWADAVAGVALWREAYGITDKSPLGPSLPPGHRDAPGRARAAEAGSRAIELSTGRRASPGPASIRYDHRHDVVQASTPTPARGPELGR